VQQPLVGWALWALSTTGFYFTYLAAWDVTRPPSQPLAQTQAYRTAIPMLTAFEVVGLIVLLGGMPFDRMSVSGHPRRSCLLRRARRRRLAPFAAATGLNLIAGGILLVSAWLEGSTEIAEYVALVVNLLTVLAMITSLAWAARFLAHRLQGHTAALINALGGWIAALAAAGGGWLAYHAWFRLVWTG
jgi:hypothetical protein